MRLILASSLSVLTALALADESKKQGLRQLISRAEWNTFVKDKKDLRKVAESVLVLDRMKVLRVEHGLEGRTRVILCGLDGIGRREFSVPTKEARFWHQWDRIEWKNAMTVNAVGGIKEQRLGPFKHTPNPGIPVRKINRHPNTWKGWKREYRKRIRQNRWLLAWDQIKACQGKVFVREAVTVGAVDNVVAATFVDDGRPLELTIVDPQVAQALARKGVRLYVAQSIHTEAVNKTSLWRIKGQYELRWQFYKLKVAK